MDNASAGKATVRLAADASLPGWSPVVLDDGADEPWREPVVLAAGEATVVAVVVTVPPTARVG